MKRFSPVLVLLAYFSVVLISCLPNAPTDLTVVSTGEGFVLLTWTDNSTVEIGYRVEISEDGEVFETALLLPENADIAAVNDLECETEYYFRVIAYREDDESLPSNVVQATTTTCPPPCQADEEISCGDTVTGTTVGALRRLRYYCCVAGVSLWPPLNAGERIYRLELDRDTLVRANLVSDGCDLRLFSINECNDEELCEGCTSGSMMVHLSPGVSYLVVDGYQGEECGFELSVECQDAPVWTKERISEMQQFSFVDLAVGPDGFPQIVSAESDPENVVRHAVRTANGWSVETVMEFGYTGSFAVDRQGQAHIVYPDYESPEIRHIRKDSGEWISETVVSGQRRNVSLVLDEDDVPHIGFRGLHPEEERYGLIYGTKAGGSWSFDIAKEHTAGLDWTIVDMAVHEGISHFACPINDIDGIGWAGGVPGDWDAASLDTILYEGDAIYTKAVAVGPTGEPAILYDYHYNGTWEWTLRLATREGGTWSIEDVNTFPYEHFRIAGDLVIDPDGNFFFSSDRNGSRLEVGTDAYGDWVYLQVEKEYIEGNSIPLVLDEDRRFHIAYLTDGALYYATAVMP